LKPSSTAKTEVKPDFRIPAHGLYLTEITYELPKALAPDGSGNLFVLGFRTKKLRAYSRFPAPK